MAFWWDLLQQYQIGKRRGETKSIEDRLRIVEEDLTNLYFVVERIVNRLDELDEDSNHVEEDQDSGSTVA